MRADLGIELIVGVVLLIGNVYMVEKGFYVHIA